MNNQKVQIPESAGKNLPSNETMPPPPDSDAIAQLAALMLRVNDNKAPIYEAGVRKAILTGLENEEPRQFSRFTIPQGPDSDTIAKLTAVRLGVFAGHLGIKSDSIRIQQEKSGVNGESRVTMSVSGEDYSRMRKFVQECYPEPKSEPHPEGYRPPVGGLGVLEAARCTF